MTLVVRGLGPVPAFKNSKLLARGRLITKPEYKRWMQRCVRAFESQLLSGTATGADATRTVLPPPCSTASLLPEDDCWTFLSDIRITAELCREGDEGATVTIERIT